MCRAVIFWVPLQSHGAVPGKYQTCYIMQTYPLEINYYEEQGYDSAGPCSAGLLAGLWWMKSRCPVIPRRWGRGSGYKWLVHNAVWKTHGILSSKPCIARDHSILLILYLFGWKLISVDPILNLVQDDLANAAWMNIIMHQSLVSQAPMGLWIHCSWDIVQLKCHVLN